jgi:ubiquitin carboxyl-terminal hydrolase 5/13
MSLCEHCNDVGTLDGWSKVYKDECMWCFDDQKSENGVWVCLKCFKGGCKGALNHAHDHSARSGHVLFLQIRAVPHENDDDEEEEGEENKDGTVAAVDDDDDQKDQKDDEKKSSASLSKDGTLTLTLQDENMQRFEEVVSVECLRCASSFTRDEQSNGSNAWQLVDQVLAVDSATAQVDRQAWEHKIGECEHVRELAQDDSGVRLASKSMATCGQCELGENLWLCMTCGALGCGRRNYDGSGGNGHGVGHYEASGHPVVCKMGTVSAEGTADLFCYRCDDAVKDSRLGEHFAHFGVDFSRLEKTEKTTGELELEQNLALRLRTQEDDELLDPVAGPGITGIQNIGNSCYIASVLQCLFNLPAFEQRYASTAAEHHASCTADDAAQCFHCQMAKLAHGLFSGRYASTDFARSGIAPRMIKKLVAGTNEDFVGPSQQDAHEYAQHLLACIAQNERRNGADADPTAHFQFALEQRIQCTECKRYRDSEQRQQDLTLSIPTPADADGDVEKERACRVALDACVDTFFAPEAVPGFACPQCQHPTVATRTFRVRSSPRYLLVALRRQLFTDWVPRKLHTGVDFDVASATLDLQRHAAPFADVDGAEPLPADAAVPATDDHATDKYRVDEAVVGQLTVMDVPRNRAARAVYSSGNVGADAAMNWLFEHMDDAGIDAPFPPPAEEAAGSAGAQVDQGMVDNLVAMLGELDARVRKALAETDSNPDRAVDWLFSHPDDDGSADSSPSSSSSSASSSAVPADDDNSPPRYRCVAFIEHRGGSVHSGHYVSYLRKSVGGQVKWLQFNDSRVHITPVPPAHSSYMLVFEKES